MTHAYITKSSRFLPGPPIGNNEVEQILGLVHGQPSRLKRKILQANGIKTRHYAMNANHETTHSNVEMAVNAGKQVLQKASIPTSKVGMLACATSQGDMVLPGFGSMVHAELPLGRVELHTAHGICSCSIMALNAAVNALRLGDQSNALVIASELASRLFKNTRYEAVHAKKSSDFSAEFLRWMLSDGAGALLLQNKPVGNSLRIDWIRSFSHAHAYPVCMSVGRSNDDMLARTWQDYPSFADAERDGALLLRQNVRLLDDVVKTGVDGALWLIEQGLLDVNKLTHLLCHYSSHHFKGRIFELLSMAGAMIEEQKWYTNLYSRGNTGSASIFIMLDEFLEQGLAEPGDTILLMVPESGRFNSAYVHLTMIGEHDE